MTGPRGDLRGALADRYAIERELGRGGMATVYLARDLRHDRPVALKVLHPELAASLGPERFQREIRFAARLQHPHVLTVLDSGDASGQLWFTMPFVEGESLRDRLRRERQLPLDDALRIAREAAQALQHAHDHGVVHRDIKPENLLLTPDGSTLVADFGIARALGGTAGGREGGTLTALTATGMSVGTPAYMSPEQATGDRALDARSDIYALACVLYEMLAGEPPYTGATAQQIIVRRFTDPVPSVRGVRPSVPEVVDQAIQKALAPVPADRFAGAVQFASALQGAAATPASSPAVGPTAAAPAVAPPPVPAVRGTRRRVPIAALALGVGFLIGLGVLFAWRQSHPPGGSDAASTGRAKLVAVLPFENLGDSTEEYFSDGITDEVRGKLAGLGGLQVTARSSSRQYKRTAKSPQEIGRELGVEYLLTGTVRWEKRQGGSRVRVSPELIQVSTGATRWQQPFDASLTDVFKVQADIAGRVAQALDLALGASQQVALAERPTANLTAYDVYLKGQAIRALGSNPSTLRQALTYFEQAVALDSTFVAAWVALSEASSLMYGTGRPSPELADLARSAAERALALDAKHPGGYRALGDYYRRVPGVQSRALEQYRKGLQLAPADADLLRGLGLSERALGQAEQSVEHLRRSRNLDPRSANTAQALGGTLLWLRRYPEALSAFDHALPIEPAHLSALEGKAMVYLAQGDLPSAQAVLAAPPAGVDLPTFVAYLATYWDLYWALNDAQRALLFRLSSGPFDGDAGTWGLALAGGYEVAGNMKRARAYADSARAAFEQQLKATPENAQRLVLLGVALAYLGRRDEAIKAGEQALALQPIEKDAQSGPYNQHQLARIYILLGEPEKALDRLEPLLKIPYFLSPGWRKIDPTFDPIRKHPRFQRLVERTASS